MKRVKFYADGGQMNNDIDYKYNNYLNNSMKQYAQGGDLTRFDEGGTHEQNPLGGVPQGQSPDGKMNTVEQGETKKGNFIYSNRIALDKELVKQFNLPTYAANKSVSDASKAIEDKFKDRQDKYAQETKNTLLDRLSQAQEYVKEQESSEQHQAEQSMQANSQQVPDMMEGQIPEGMEEYATSAEQVPQEEMVEEQSMNPASPIAAFGGYQMKRFDLGGPIGANLKPAGLVPLQGATLSAPTVPTSAGMNPVASTAVPGAPGAGPSAGGVIQAAGTAMELGKMAFGKSAQDTNGDAESAKVDTGGMAASGAMKGAQAGMAFGPWGAAAGAVIGGAAGLIGAGKQKRDALTNSNRFAYKQNSKFSDNYAAYGGELNIDMLNDPTKKKPVIEAQTAQLPIKKINYNVETPGVKEGNLPPGYYTRVDYNNGKSDYLRPEGLSELQRMNNYRLYMESQAANQKKFLLGGDTQEDPITAAMKKTINPANTFGQNVNFTPSAPVFSKGTPSLSAVHDKLGIDKNNTGYGTTFGKGSMKAMDAIRSANKAKTGVPLGPNDYKLLGLKNNTFRYSDKSNRFSDNVSSLDGSLKRTNPMDFYKDANIKEAAAKSAALNQKDSSSIIGEALRYAPVAANAYQLATLKKPGGVNYQTLDNRYKPSYVDEAQMQRTVDQEANNQLAAIGQSGASQGAMRASILAAGLNKTKALGDAYANAAAQNRATDDRAQEFNRNTDLQNMANRNKAIDEERMDEAAYRGAKSKLLSTIGTDVGHIGKEISDAKLARTLTGYTRVGDYVMRPDGTKATPQESSLFDYYNKTKKQFGGYLNVKKRK